MRRKKTVRVDARQVHAHAREWIEDKLGIEGRGRKCTTRTIISILLVAASRISSLYAACRDISGAPSDQALRDALFETLPEISQLEQRINDALTWKIPRRVLVARRALAIDVVLIPYYGKPDEDPSELYHSKQKAGTTKFHGYATACIVHHGMRYTVALTRVSKGEKMPAVTKRLVEQARAAGLNIKVLLADRGFFTVDVIKYLQQAEVPFVMPLAIRGLKAKSKARRDAGLRRFQKEKTGWYRYTFHGKNKPTISVCVCVKRPFHKKTGKRKVTRYLYGAWRYKADPCQVRTLYRTRFGIETSYRQVNQSRIRTCSRNPSLRLLFFALAEILRNVWVWLHFTYFADSRGESPTLHLERLRYRRMLEWITAVITTDLHDGSLPATEWQPGS